MQEIPRQTDERGWRWYQHEGKNLISITTVLDAYLNKDDQEFLLGIDLATYGYVMEATAKAGTEIGELCKTSLEPNFVCPPKYKKPIENWLKLVEKNKIEPLEWEKRVVSTKYGYAGAIDLIANVRGVKGIIEIKSGKYRKKAGYQAEAQRMAEFEMTDELLPTHVAHIHRDGSTRKLYSFAHHEFLFTKFLSALELFKGDYATILNDLEYAWRYRNAFRDYFNLPQLETKQEVEETK